MKTLLPNRLPAQLEQRGGKSKRQRIWEAIRLQRSSFSIIELYSHTGVEVGTIKSYLQALDKAAVISVIQPRHDRTEKRWALAQDAGVEAPRLTRDGKPVRQGLAQEQMWRTMRILQHDFTATELARMAATDQMPVSPAAAKDYLGHLCKAGYLRLTSKGLPGKAARYQFNRTRYTGPRPPMIQRSKCVYDPNLARVIWQEDIRHDDD